MAKRRKMTSARFAGMRRRERRVLLGTTALQATGIILLAFPAMAQVAPTARPTGGQVVAGQASITQTTAQTSVNQASQRAAVDWRSYDVGSQHAVVYRQPNSSAIILNRVTGPDPSQIAGRISANGQVVIVNQSGVVFHNGSQIDAQSLVVSAPGITNQNFMAGRMVFDQAPRPGAQVTNAGTITVQQSGLAALVAPQVSNSGTIQARMGRVTLAGAEAHVIDMYGDGLMSVDVTRQVRTAPGGGKALVTNTGVVSADGGTVTLTASAADGIVSNLIHAGGRIDANSLPDKPGSIVIAGVGGSITVAGSVRADGRAPGTSGGTIHLSATDTVTVASGARVTASGRAGGGTIAIGTTPARAVAQGAAGGSVPAGTARQAIVEAGAKVSANGRGTGSGGAVAVLSTGYTGMAGRITAKGSRAGGNGGNIEISGERGLRITGTADVTAAKGRPGKILIDPRDLTISESGPDLDPTVPAPADANISAATFNNFNGAVSLSATRDIFTTNITSLGNATTQTSITLTAGNNISLSGPISLAGKPVMLTATAGNVTQTAAGAIQAGNLTATAGGNVLLATATNTVGTLAGVTAGGDALFSTAAPSLTVSGAVTAGGGSRIFLTSPEIVVGDAVANAGRLRFGTVSGGVFTATGTPGSAVTLRTDALTLNAPLGGGRAIEAPSGTVNIAPNTAGLTLSVDPVRVAGRLSLTQGDLDQIGTLGTAGTGYAASAASNQAVLQLGRLTPPDGTTAATTAGEVMLTGSASLSSTAATLGLYAQAQAVGGATSTGNVTAAVGAGVTLGSAAVPGGAPRYFGTLTGAASGTVSLGTVPGSARDVVVAPQNHFDVLRDFTAGNGLSLSMATTAAQGLDGLKLLGTVAGGPSLSLLSVGLNTGGSYRGGTIVMGDTTSATVGGTGSVVRLAARDGAGSAASITQTANSTLTAARLTGSVLTADAGVGYNVVLDSANNAVADLAGFTVGPPQPDGTYAVQGGFTLRTKGALTIDAPADLPVIAGNVAITAGSVAVQGGNVGAREETGLTGTVSLTATGVGVPGTITVAAGALVGSQGAMTLASALGTTVSDGTVNAGRTAAAGMTALNGSIGVSGGLTITGGQVFAAAVTVTDGLTQSGGKLAATTLTADTYNFSGGNAYAGNTLTVSSPGLPLGSVLTSGDNILVSGTVPSFASAGTIAAVNDVRIQVPGSFTQTAGRVAAGRDVFVTGTGGDLSPASGTISQAAGTLAAGRNLLLYASGTGPATLAGTLAGATVTAAEFNAALTMSAAVRNGITLSGLGYAATYHCTGCDTQSVASLTIGTPSVSFGAGAGRPTLLRLDANILTLTSQVAADTVELHSVLDTTQTASGPITADLLRGTAGYAATIAAGSLPTYVAPGTTGIATLNAPTNAVNTLGPYLVRGNDTTHDGFSLTNSVKLTVVDTVTAGGGSRIFLTSPEIVVGDAVANAGRLRFGTVSGGVFTATGTPGSAVTLRTDALTLNAPLGGGRAIEAPSGTVNIAPNTAGLTLSVDPVRVAGRLSLTQGDLDQIGTLGTAGTGYAASAASNQAVLQLGRLTPPDGTTAATTAGEVMLTGSASLSSTAATLGLYAQAQAVGGATSTGNVTAAVGAGVTLGSAAVPGGAPRYFGTLTGAASGTVSLGTVPGSARDVVVAPQNHFDVLRDFTAGNGLSLSMATTAAQGLDGLKLLGTVAGGPSLSLLSVGLNTGGSYRGGTIVMGDTTSATVGGTGSVVRLAARDGAGSAASITQTANSTLTAARLTGSVLTADAGVGYNVVLDSANNAVADLAGFTVGPPQPDGTYAVQGGFTLRTKGALTIDAPADLPVIAGNVAITAGSVAVQGGNVGAREETGLTGTVSLTATGVGVPGTITVAAGALVGSQGAMTLASALGTTVSDGTVNAGRTAAAGMTALNGSIGVSGGLTITGGQVFAAAVTVTDGLTQSGGKLAATTLTADTYNFSGGNAYAGNTLTVSSPGLPLGSVLTSGDNILVSGTVPSFASAGTIAAVNDVRIQVPGSFTQTAGRVAAGRDVFVTGTGGDLSPASGTISQAAGTLAAGRNLLLYASGTGPATLAGTLAGATVTAAEFNAALTMSAAVRNGITLSGLGYAATYHCTGCDTQSVASLTIGTPSVSFGAGAGRPTLLRLDANILTLTSQVAADTVELHSVLDTTQTASGPITADLLRGTAGYAATIAAGSLPTYVAPGTTGIATLNAPTNAVNTLGPYLVRGNDTTHDGFSLTNSVKLTVVDTVTAGSAAGPLTATELGALGNNVSITLTGANRDLVIGTAGVGAVLAGRTVTLTATGNITEVEDGRVAAATLSGSAMAAAFDTATIGSAGQLGNQIGTLSTFAATAGALTLTNGRSLQVDGVSATDALSITTHSGRNTPSDAEGQAAGNLMVSNVRGATAGLAAFGDLNGSGVAANTGVTLTAGGSVNIGGISAVTLSGRAGSDFTSEGTFASVGSIQAGRSLSIVDARTLTVTGPLSGPDGVAVRTTAGNMTVNGAVISSGDIIVSTAGTLTTAQANTVSAGRALTISAAGGVSLAGTLAAGTSTSVVTGGNAVLASTSTVRTGSQVAVSAAGTIDVAGTMTAGTSITFDTGQSVRLAGNETAPRVVVGGSTTPSRISLAGGTLQVGGVPQPAGIQLDALPQTANSAAPGLFLHAAALDQTGTTQVTSLGAQATVRLDVPGAVNLNNLIARSSNLILDLDAGTARGTIAVNSLTVLYSNGGGANLSGTVRDLLTGAVLGGTEAASASRIGRSANGSVVPLPDRQYQLNGCAIASVNCVVITTATAPVTNPLKELNLSFFRAQDNDADLLIPDITDQGL